jgi:probable HAF family extracellular repeat protein
MLKNTATLALSLFLVSAVLAAAPKTWTITQVLNEGSLIAITDSGRVIGQLRGEADEMLRPFVWHRGNFTDLPLNFTPADVNNSGQVVGWTRSQSVEFLAALWDHGTLVDLGMVPGYTRAFPSAINNSGQVVGRVTRWLAGVEESVGVLWSNGSVLALDGMGTARDINDNGQIVGASPDGHAVLWEAGTITRLPQPHADGTSAAMAINNRGQAVGCSTWGPRSTTYPAVLWDGGTAIELQLPPEVDWPSAACATGINGRGQIVGTVWYPGFRTVPAIWEDGVLTQLPFDWGSTEGVRALGINNRGDIIGTSIDYGAEFGVLWTR